MHAKWNGASWKKAGIENTAVSSVSFAFLPRLALTAVLRLLPKSMGVLAPVCSSMGYLASSQSKRCFVQPLGDCSKGFVASGNLLAARRLVCIKAHGFVDQING